MSNGDDVLDNWEEIDEAGLNRTLQKIDAVRQTKNKESLSSSSTSSTATTIVNTGVNKNSFISGENVNNFPPMKLLQRTPKPDNNSSNVSSSTTTTPSPISSNNSGTLLKSPLDDMASSFQPVMMVLHKPVDEYQSANYTQPINSQTVKILRRPTQSMEPRNNGMKPRQPIKTLQQREQEYAEARLRILGAAKNPEDDMSSNAATSNTTTITSMSSNNTAAAASAVGSGFATITNSSLAISAVTATTLTSPSLISGNGGGGGGGGIGGINKSSWGTPISRTNSASKIQTSGGQILYNSQYHHQSTHAFQLAQQQQQQQQQNYYFPQTSPSVYNSRGVAPLLPQTTASAVAATTTTTMPLMHAQQTWSPAVGGSVSSPLLRQQQQQQQMLQQQQKQQQQQQKQQQQQTMPLQQQYQDSILRMPRGPDGSLGFQMRR